MMVTLLGRCGLGRAGERPGGERRRRPVQLRRHGARAARRRARSCACARRAPTTGRTTSNIVWNYAHETIPRHLRDIVDHRVRHRRPARPHRRGGDRGAAERRRLALPGAAAGARQGRRQDRARDYRIPDALPRQPAAAPERGLRARARRAASSASIPSAPISPPRRSRSRARSRFLEAHSTACAPARLRSLAAALPHGGAAAHARGARSGAWGSSSPRGLRERLQRRLLAWALEASAGAASPSGGARPRARRACAAALRGALRRVFLRAPRTRSLRPAAARLRAAPAPASSPASALRRAFGLFFRRAARLRRAGAAFLAGRRPCSAAAAAAVDPAQLLEDRRILERRDVLGDLLAARDRPSAAGA